MPHKHFDSFSPTRFPLRFVPRNAEALFIAGKLGDVGASGKDNRLFLEAVLWIVRTGSPWRDLPSELGNWHTTYTRFIHWGGLEQRAYDRHVYDRNLVERFFCRIKQLRRLATRYEKLAVNFSSMLAFVCTLIWLR